MLNMNDTMQIRKEFLPLPKGDNKYEIPPACYTVTLSEIYRLMDVLKSFKVSDGYASNIFKCITVKNHKISALKSHNCLVLMQ